MTNILEKPLRFESARCQCKPIIPSQTTNVATASLLKFVDGPHPTVTTPPYYQDLLTDPAYMDGKWYEKPMWMANQTRDDTLQQGKIQSTGTQSIFANRLHLHCNNPNSFANLMKKFLLIFFILSTAAFALESEITTVNKALIEGDAELLSRSLIDLNSAIARLEPLDSPINKPSPARIEARKIIASSLQPLKQTLIQLITNSNQSIAGTATVILGHIPNDDDVREALASNLAETSNPDIATKSLAALFQTGQADALVKRITATRISKFDLQDNSGRSVALALLRSACYNPIPEAFETYVYILRNDTGIPVKLLAIQALMQLGPEADAAIPYIEKLLHQLEQQGGDERDISTIRRAIKLIRRGSKKASAGETITH